MQRQRGFGYLILIFALAVMGLVLAGFGQSWKISSQREKETELLAIGQQFSAAMTSYQRVTPAGQPNTPASLDELLEDKRFPFTVRHLRRLYRDPMTGQPNWQVDVLDGRIVSISSRSEREALRQPKALPRFVSIASKAEVIRYRDWLFVKQATPPTASNTEP
ncbi:type II secretion system protein [Uliginosibacterium flavum]|uniref:Type II secretion system protein n=1 Tax=Uliginosibacterium flavum TaxID=1396831 RepID=A0ABV2TIB1_9RHOO